MAKTYLLRNNRPSIQMVGSTLGKPLVRKRLFNGNNEVTEAEWDSIKGNPHLAILFKKRQLEWVAGRGPDDFKETKAEDGKGAEESTPLSGLSVDDALQVVGETYDLDTLKKWKELESRKKVSSAIEEQLSKLVLPKKK